MSLSNIKGNTLDSKTIILAVSEDDSGNGYDVSTGASGILWTTTLPYAKNTNRRGLPIYASTANPNTYWDIGGTNDVCRIDLIDTSTGAEFQDASGNEIYAKFHDGADYPTGSGTGELTDVYVRFYTVSGTYIWTSGDPSNVSFVYPFRKVMNELEEDVVNLWSFTGAIDDLTGPSFNNTGDYYLVGVLDTDLTSAVDSINTGLGDFTYTEQNYVTDNESISSSLDELDQAAKDVSDSVTASSGDRYTEELSGDVNAGELHSLPYSITYTPDATVGQEGQNMDVYVNGQLLAASSGLNGANEDRDYAETTASGITFHFDVYSGSNVVYMVRQ
jgi:hypothetical protein